MYKRARGLNLTPPTLVPESVRLQREREADEWREARRPLAPPTVEEIRRRVKMRQKAERKAERRKKREAEAWQKAEDERVAEWNAKFAYMKKGKP